MSLLNVAAALTAVGSPANSEVMSLQAIGAEVDQDDNRVPQPSHRHASPSAPWPWIDLDDEVDRNNLDDPAPSIPDFCPHDNSCNNCWNRYPQSRFPNWTYAQVAKSKIQRAITEYNKDDPCTMYRVDVDSHGFFTNVETITAEHGGEEDVWQMLIHEKRPRGLRVRAIFIENLSGPILQMLGTIYNIEPFFWSSSLNWIPSRFQAEIQPGRGDHITITLTFLKCVSDQEAVRMNTSYKSMDSLDAPSTMLGSQKIDTRAPLVLYSSNKPRLVLQDLLSVHLIRNVNGSTIISYHPNMNLPTTKAPFFHARIRFAGQSVYWQTIFQKSPDPTFIFLTFVWHALYAWDEALENLYEHICYLESRVMNTSDINLAQELHVIRAHQLHYTSLLDDFLKHIIFIKETHNSMMDSFSDEHKEYVKETMERECNNLMLEATRLKNGLLMQEKRLTNVLDLVFSRVNIDDSRYLSQMTAANVKDSAGTRFAMRQISYLTMAFLPASFASGFFGMNVQELTPGTSGHLTHYFAVALPLTLITTWIVTVFQYRAILPEDSSIYKRLAWPVFLVINKIEQREKLRKMQEEIPLVSVMEYEAEDEEEEEKKGDSPTEKN